MSEEDENGLLKKRTDVTITLDRSKEMTDLEMENAKLKNQLENLAQQEFEERCHKYNLDPTSTTVDELKAIEKVKEQEHDVHGGDTTPLNASQITGKTQLDQKFEDIPISLLEFSSEAEMVQVLRTIAENASDSRSEKARIALKLLAQKELSQSAEYELEGKVSDWARKGNKFKPIFRKVEKDSEKVE